MLRILLMLAAAAGWNLSALEAGDLHVRMSTAVQERSLQEASSKESDEMTYDEVGGIRNTDTGQVICLRMKSEEILKRFGEPESREEDAASFVELQLHYEGLSVGFHQNRAVFLSTEHPRYETLKQIAAGDAYQEVRTAYGERTMDAWEFFLSPVYIFAKQDQGKMEFITSLEHLGTYIEREDEEKFYWLEFSLDENQYVESIRIVTESSMIPQS